MSLQGLLTYGGDDICQKKSAESGVFRLELGIIIDYKWSPELSTVTSQHHIHSPVFPFKGKLFFSLVYWLCHVYCYGISSLSLHSMCERMVRAKDQQGSQQERPNHMF
jgi:hypothetical protein